MFGEVQHAAGARDLNVDRRGGVEPMLPIDREAEKADVELARLLDTEDAEDRDRLQCRQRQLYVLSAKTLPRTCTDETRMGPNSLVFVFIRVSSV